MLAPLCLQASTSPACCAGSTPRCAARASPRACWRASASLGLAWETQTTHATCEGRLPRLCSTIRVGIAWLYSRTHAPPLQWPGRRVGTCRRPARSRMQRLCMNYTRQAACPPCFLPSPTWLLAVSLALARATTPRCLFSCRTAGMCLEPSARGCSTWVQSRWAPPLLAAGPIVHAAAAWQPCI